MDRFTYIEGEAKCVKQCICKQELKQGDNVFELDDYLICDDSDCFKKLCVKKLGAVYGTLDKSGNIV